MIRNKNFGSTLAHARRIENVEPGKVKRKPGRESRPVDADALAAELERLDALAEQVRDGKTAAITNGHNTRPATGECHACERPVSGDRRFCGPCLARRI